MIERYSRPQMKKIWSDQGKFDKWLQIEIASCQAWAELGIISKEDVAKIEKAHFELERIGEILQETHHDVTAFTGAVSESLGEESRFIHLGLTSSDVMDTALSLQLVEASDILIQHAAELITVLEEKAVEHKYTIMMGRTHGIHAEPTTFGLKLAIWVEEMKRHAHRLNEARANIAVGKISGAVGTYATIPPEIEQIVCSKLGLTPASISNQIIQRDRHAQFIATLAILSSSLEKFATEIRHLQRTEVQEAEEPFARGQTGSSSMPHKRNPELCERICGLARLVRGYSVTAMENVALWHERDISHSSTERITLPDSCMLLDYAFSLFTPIVKNLTVHTDRMKENMEITHGLLFSQRILLALIDKGLSRQSAYKLVQRNAMKSWEEGLDFLELLQADADVTSELPQDELAALFDYSYYLKHVDYVFDKLGLNKPTRKNTQDKINSLAPRTV
ncbi:MAG: adenylosuccinate lyase [Dehalococcoidia bacterium]|nr:adenylosuccinate lyase [Dehalococcoidia bacterium]